MAKRTALYEWHKSSGARLVDFAGWEMPVQYTDGAIAEHQLVRTSLGIFDVSHMAQFEVSGKDATSWLNHMVSADTSGVGQMASTYALLCQEDGGVLDDLFLYRFDDDWLVVANAANEEKDIRWLLDHLPGGKDVVLENASDKYAMFAVQGPNAVTVIDSLTGGAATSTQRFAATSTAIDTIELTMGRTGYTGEDGVELFVPNEHAQRVWTAVLEEAGKSGIAGGPIGLAARDSLRFEPGFALYGHELTQDVTPVEARLTWACALDTEFIGSEAIRRRKASGPATRLSTLRMVDKGVPRQGCEVYSEGKKVGEVCSGMYAPTVDAYCANAFLLPESSKNGTVVEVDIRGKRKRAEVAKRPLYTPAYR